MENSTKAIIIAATVVITLALVTVGFLVLRSGQETAKSAITRLDKMNNQLAESEYLIYDQTEVSGSEVVNALRKFEGEYIGIQVITGKNVSGTSYIYNITKGATQGEGEIGSKSSYDIGDTIDEESNEYVNPNGRFKGEVIRDKNGVIIGIVFTQLGRVTP